MKKRILALLLAVIIVIGTPAAYAEEPAAEAAAAVSVEVTAPAAPAAETAGTSEEPATEATATTPEETSGQEAEYAADAAPVSETETEENGTKETEKEETAASSTGSAGSSDGYVAAINAENTTEIAVTEGLTFTIMEVSNSDTEETIPEGKETVQLSDGETEKNSPAAELTALPTPTVPVDSHKYIPDTSKTGGDVQITSMSLSSPVTVTGELSEKTFIIDSITLGTMQANEDYQYLEFSFSDGENTYEGYVAGITVYSVKQEGNEKTADERITDLVAAVADHYYADHCFLLSDVNNTGNNDVSCVEKYGLSINSIDTEKIKDQDYTKVTEDPDSLLCWAASASNMLEFTGWNDLATALGLTDEDKLFNYFASSYVDIGSSQEFGLKWFFNGVNLKENVTNEEDPSNHNVVYYNYTELEDGTILNNCYNSGGNLLFYYTSKTVTIPGETEEALTLTESDYYDSNNQMKFFYLENEDGTVRAYFKPIPEEGAKPELIFEYRNGNYYDASGNEIENPGMEYGIGSNFAQEKISSTDISEKNGNALSDYAEDNLVTFTDVCDEGDYDGLYEAAMNLKNGVATGIGVYFYDENENYKGGHAITLFGYIKDAISTGWESLKALFVTDSDSYKNQTTTREGSIDMIAMYEVSSGNMPSEICSYPVLFMENYQDERWKVPILDYTSLQPSSSEKVEETEGTKNAVTTADYVVTDLKVTDRNWETLDTVTAGDSILFYTELQNRSYDNLYDLVDPYLALTYTIVRNGVETDTLQQNVPLRSSRNPLEYEEFAPVLSLDEPGNYSITVTIDGLYATVDGTVTEMKEAYSTNNTYLKNFLFTVKERVQPPIDNTQTTESAPVISVSYDLSKGGDCVIDLPEIKGEVGSVNVNGQTLASGDYAVTYNMDGTATITFSAAFLKTLLPGTYNFRILDASGKLLTVVKLTVR